MENLFIINLRQFDDVINKTTSNGQGNDLTPEMKTFYEKTLLENAKPNLVHQQFGKKVGIPTHSGRIVEFRKFTSLPKALTPLTEGVTPKGDKLNVETVEAECEEYGNYVTMTDQLELEAIDNTVAQATKLIGENAGATLDTVVRNELMKGTNVMFCDTSAGVTPKHRYQLTSDNKFTAKMAAKANAIMRKNNVPTKDGTYVVIVHPSVEYDLITSDGWLDVVKYTDNVNRAYAGEIGKLYNLRFVRSTEAKVFHSTGNANTTDQTEYTEDTEMAIATYGCLVIGDGAYGVIDVSGGGLEIIVKQKGSAGSNDPLNQRSTVGWKITAFTAKILQPERLLRVECGSSFSDVDEAN